MEIIDRLLSGGKRDVEEPRYERCGDMGPVEQALGEAQSGRSQPVLEELFSDRLLEIDQSDGSVLRVSCVCGDAVEKEVDPRERITGLPRLVEQLVVPG